MSLPLLNDGGKDVRSILAHPRLHLFLLLLWSILGLCLRLTNLAGKPLWTDEFSTLVFSLGNSFLTVPLDQLLTTDQLLQPLQANPEAGIYDVARHLLRESNHPPLYFVLTHFWLKLFPAPDGWASVWAARSLSVLFGTLTIPAIFGLGWFAFRSRLVGQIAAALMAVSPFGIYLAQEARHYTLPLLWISASLCCTVAAARTIRDRTPLPTKVGVVWVVVNTLGIATHYFMVLTLVAEATVITLMGLVQSWREQGRWYPSSHWWRIVIVALGTIAGGIIWLPFIQDVQDSALTAWLQQGDRSGLEWLTPVTQAIAGWISMLYLLPIQANSEWIVIASGIALILLTLWTIPIIYQGLKLQSKTREARLAVLTLASFVVSAVLIFFAVTYILDRDLTSAFRYNFVYFPAVIVMIGAGLAMVWTGAIARPQGVRVGRFHSISTATPRTVILIGLISLLGGLTVVSNLGYQKTHRPDVVAQEILQRSQGHTLVAIAHRTHGQTGRLMGIAWQLRQSQPSSIQANGMPSTLDPRFLLVHIGRDSRSVVRALRQALRQSPNPLDLWLINFQDAPDKPINVLLEQQNCTVITKPKSIDGYRYQLYRCNGSK